LVLKIISLDIVGSYSAKNCSNAARASLRAGLSRKDMPEADLVGCVPNQFIT
jgi:hypothetical protein